MAVRGRKKERNLERGMGNEGYWVRGLSFQ